MQAVHIVTILPDISRVEYRRVWRFFLFVVIPKRCRCVLLCYFLPRAFWLVCCSYSCWVIHKLVLFLWIILVSKIAMKSKTAFQRAFPPLASVTLKFCTIFVCTVLTYVYFACIHMYVCVCVFVKNQSLAFMQRGMLPNKCAYKLLFIENVTIMAT